MTPEERERIYSEEYLDLIVEYDINDTILEGFEDVVIHILDTNYAVLHVPVSQVDLQDSFRIVYANIPSIFGTFNQRSLDASGVTRIR